MPWTHQFLPDNIYKIYFKKNNGELVEIGNFSFPSDLTDCKEPEIDISEAELLNCLEIDNEQI
jgi:hypothetical protein